MIAVASKPETLKEREIIAQIHKSYPIQWELDPKTEESEKRIYQNVGTNITASYQDGTEIDEICISDGTSSKTHTKDFDALEKMTPRPYHRLSLTEKATQYDSEISAVFVNEAEKICAEHILKLLNKTFSIDQLEDTTLYTIQIGTGEERCDQALRTESETLELLKEYLRCNEEKAKEVFRYCISHETWEEGFCKAEISPTSLPWRITSAKLEEIIEDPDMVGESSYRTAADLAVCVTDIGSEASECNPKEPIDQEQIRSIETEMACLIESALSIAKKCA